MKQNILKMALIVVSSAMPFYVSAADQSFTESVSNTASDMGDSVIKAGDAVGTATTDAAITTAVKTKFATDSSIPSGISVTTVDGVVYLVGTADSKAQADKAINAAKSVSGVNRVDDSKLVVKTNN